MVAGLPSDSLRLKVAEQVGADATLQGDVHEYIRERRDGLGADFVIDASGASAATRIALQCVRPAGQIVKVGWGPEPLDFSLDAMVQKNVNMTGSFSHNWPIWERVISMLVAGQINVEPLISRVAPLSAWQECFEGMEHGKYVKAVLTPEWR